MRIPQSSTAVSTRNSRRKAGVYRADLVVSWNFKHIVHYEKIAGFNAANLLQGYPELRIFSPNEVASE